MKKVITAIGNPILNQKLKQEKDLEIVSEDIQYQEGIIEILEKEKNVDFLILSELLPGEVDIKKLVERIKRENANIQMILFLEKQNEELENYLYAKGVFSILYHNQVEVQEVIQMIKNDEQNSNNELKKELEELKKLVLEKEQNTELTFKQTKKENSKKQEKQKKKDQNKSTSKEVICVSGTSGAGKSIFTVNLAKTLENKDGKILIIDFDIFNNSLHTILGIKKYSEKIKNKVKKNNLLQEIQIEELIMKVNSKIDLISGINLLFDAKYQISSTKVDKILEKLKEKYNTIIIDTSSECFFDYTKQIMKLCNLNVFIVEANLSEIKKAKKLLNIYINEWKIPQKSFNILFNKYDKNAIDYAILKNIFSGFSILGKLSSNSQYNLIINQNTNSNLSKDLQKEYIQIKQNLFQKSSYLLHKKDNRKLFK